jgi:hypothetical protein
MRDLACQQRVNLGSDVFRDGRSPFRWRQRHRRRQRAVLMCGTWRSRAPARSSSAARTQGERGGVLPGGRVITGGYDDRVRLRNVQSSSPGTLLACSAYGLATSLPHLEVASSSATQWAAFHAGSYAQRPRTRLEPGNVRGNAMPQQARASPRSRLNGGPDDELSRPRYGRFRDGRPTAEFKAHRLGPHTRKRHQHPGTGHEILLRCLRPGRQACYRRHRDRAGRPGRPSPA